MDSLTQRCVDTLRSRPISALWFRVGNLHVAPFKYRYVAELIENGRIGDQPGGVRDAKNAAEYQHDTPNSPARIAVVDADIATGAHAATGRATFVHEATHASFDVTMANKQVSSLQNEYAAFLAEQVYLCVAADSGDNGAMQACMGRANHPFFQPLIALAREIRTSDDPYVMPNSTMNEGIDYLSRKYQSGLSTMHGVPYYAPAPKPVRPKMEPDPEPGVAEP